MWSHRIGEEREAQDHEKCRAVESKISKRFTDGWPVESTCSRTEEEKKRDEFVKEVPDRILQARSHGKGQVARHYKGKRPHKVKTLSTVIS